MVFRAISACLAVYLVMSTASVDAQDRLTKEQLAALLLLLNSASNAEADSDPAPDTDGDGVTDDIDVFPDDPSEQTDTDGDGVGDNGDAFPDDPNEASDQDGDGVGDNADVFPNDPTESSDRDGDGVGDNADAFPDDPSRSSNSSLGCVDSASIACGADIDLSRAFNSFSVALPPVAVPAGVYPFGATSDEYSQTLRRGLLVPVSSTFAGRLSFQVATGTVMRYAILPVPGQSGVIDTSQDALCSGTVVFVESIVLSTRNTPAFCRLSPGAVYFLDVEYASTVFGTSDPTELNTPLVINGSFAEALSVLSN